MESLMPNSLQRFDFEETIHVIAKRWTVMYFYKYFSKSKLPLYCTYIFAYIVRYHAYNTHRHTEYTLTGFSLTGIGVI